MDWWTIKKSWLRHFDLKPQAISEALLAAFGNLGSTFGSSKTTSEPLGDQRGVFWGSGLIGETSILFSGSGNLLAGWSAKFQGDLYT